MKQYIFGNWKQNGDDSLVEQMITTLTTLPKQNDQVVAIFPPDVFLSTARHRLQTTDALKLGAQNLSAYADGPYTGEVSGRMLQQVGASFVLVGHSERRQLFAETDDIILAKFQHALAAQLIPVLCVGEDLHAHETNQTLAVIEKQLTAVFAKNNYENQELIIAYEPIWAIGTGKVASKEQAQTVHAWIRRFLNEFFSKDQAQDIPIIYGGSVKAENAQSLLGMPDINGLLVGGASLDPQSFTSIALK